MFSGFQRACDFPVFAHLPLSLRSRRTDITTRCRDCPPGLDGCERGHLSPHQTSGGVGAESRFGTIPGSVHPGRIDLQAFVSCASFFSVGGYVRFHMVAGRILLRLRLGYAPGQTRGRWSCFLLKAEQALEKSHLDTSNLSHSNLVTPQQAPLPTNGVLDRGTFRFRTGFVARPKGPYGKRGVVHPPRSLVAARGARGFPAEAIATVHGAVATGLEGDFCLLAAVVTEGGIHLSLPPAITALTAFAAARLAAG